MKEEDVKKIIEDSLKKVAPEVNLSDINLSTPFRNQVDIDSYDLYNMLARIEAATHVRIPEAEMREIDTLSGLIRYIVNHGSEAIDLSENN